MQTHGLSAAKEKEFVSFQVSPNQAAGINAVQSVTGSNIMLVKVGESPDRVTLIESGMKRKHIMLAAGSSMAGLIIGIIVGRVTKR